MGYEKEEREVGQRFLLGSRRMFAELDKGSRKTS